jgi:peptide/nickel transport system permease protein
MTRTGTHAEQSPPVRSARLRVPGLIARTLRRPLAAIAAVYLVILVAATIFAPLLAPYPPDSENLLNELSGPTGSHLLGTDELGRDVLSRLLYGGRLTLGASVEAVVVFVVVGVPLGLAAGFLGGWLDRAIMYVTELLLSIPGLLLILVVAAVFPGKLLLLMIVLGLVATPSIVRVVRSSVLSVRRELYVVAARVVGSSRRQILRRHILARIAGPVIVQSTVFAASAIVIEAILGYLSLDASPPTPTWGSMMAEGAQEIATQAWLIVPTGTVLALTVLALGVLGDAFRDASVEQWSSVREVRRRPGAPRRGGHRTTAGDRAASRTDNQVGRPDAVLSVRHLSVAFPRPQGEVNVVEGVSFDVMRAEIVGVVGESGCGKSATANAILGVLPGNGKVTGGEILFQGKDLVSLKRKEQRGVRGRQIAVVSQDPMLSLDPNFTVGDQLQEAVHRHLGISRSLARRRAVELLSRVRLAEPELVMRQRPYELSGGMAQRVCIAIALAGDPILLIADEPTTALDVTVQAEILDLFSALRNDAGLSVLLISHDWGVIADVCDRVLVMYAGEIVEEAEVEEMFDRALHPYSAGLMAANPHLASPGDRLPSIPGIVPSPEDWPPGCHFFERCRYAQADCSAEAIHLLRVGEGRTSRCIHVSNLIAGRR